MVQGYNEKTLKNALEVLAQLVLAAVFKTVGRRVNRVAGGFDSHALPFFFSQQLIACRTNLELRRACALFVRVVAIPRVRLLRHSLILITFWGFRSGDDLVDDFSMDIRQAEVASGIAVGESLVIET